MKGPILWPGRIAIGLGILMSVFSALLLLAAPSLDLSSLLLLLPLVCGALAIKGGMMMMEQARVAYRVMLWMLQASKAHLS